MLMVLTHFREAAVGCRFQGESVSFDSTVGFKSVKSYRCVGCSWTIGEGGERLTALSGLVHGRLDSEYLALFIYKSRTSIKSSGEASR